MRIAPIYLDRLDHSLRTQGITLKRAQLLETASYTFGYHNSGEFNAAARAGDLCAPAAQPVARVTVEGETLIVVRDPVANSLYAVDEEFIGQVVEGERRERFGPSPYGHLLDMGDIADHPVTSWARDAMPDETSNAPGGCFVVMSDDNKEQSRHDDETAAQETIEIEDNASREYVVDVAGGRAMHYDWGWRTIEVEGRDEAETFTAAALAVSMARLEKSRRAHETTLRLDVPDWRAWHKDLKKASHKRQEPISDEILHQMRHAVADVHCKSSDSERSEVEWRQRLYVEKHLGGLLARLDRAEEALREAGLAPAEIARRSKDDAAETMAAIDAVSTTGDREMPGLYEVEATHDGEKFHEVYRVGTHELHEDRGRELAAAAFRMNLEDFRDEDGELWMFDSECDTFEIRPVMYPKAAAIISDALVQLSTGGDFRHGIPHSHPARIKLIAAREMLVPKPTA